MLPIAAHEGLPFVEITADVDNRSSRHVIEANGATLVEVFTKLPSAGGGQAARYRIELALWRA